MHSPSSTLRSSLCEDRAIWRVAVFLRMPMRLREFQEKARAGMIIFVAYQVLPAIESLNDMSLPGKDASMRPPTSGMSVTETVINNDG